MSDTHSDLWCRRAEYGPYILRGRQRWVMLAGELRDDPAYRLVFVEDGVSYRAVQTVISGLPV